MSRPGAPQLTWLNALNSSTRKSRYCFSVTWNFFPTDASKLKKLGARRVPTPTFPSVPSAGRAERAGTVVHARGAEVRGRNRTEEVRRRSDVLITYGRYAFARTLPRGVRPPVLAATRTR